MVASPCDAERGGGKVEAGEFAGSGSHSGGATQYEKSRGNLAAADA